MFITPWIFCRFQLHMLGEGGSRGAILETTLTKVMHSSGWFKRLFINLKLSMTIYWPFVVLEFRKCQQFIHSFRIFL